ncbi:MAG: efflux RND transporter permease subunit [Treponema sp.]|nr:efflux RND transporter permease subunit [Treponema sp.]MCL2252518.1 efflux RND transporter permease subunit [Treponema sp.]
MSIIEYSVKRPVTIVMFFILVIGISASLLVNLAMDLYPSVDRPVFSIWTRFPGAGPADVERNVTERLERSLSSSRRLVNMTSNSQFESSSITLEFSYGTDMDKAVNDAQILVNRLVNSLPDGVQTPIVRRFDMNAMPIMRLVVRGNYPPDQLRLFAEDEIQSAIERIEGVAAAEVTGGTTQVVKVEVSLNRLAAFNLTLSDISSALKGQNVLSSGGNLRRGTREYQIMTQEELVSIEQIKRLVVRTINTGTGQNNRYQLIRIEDVADVFLGYNDNASRVHVNGQSGVYIQVTCESGSNQINVSNRVQAALDEINSTLPQGITLQVLSDNTTMIRATLDQVYNNAIQGALMAMVILMIFLRNTKATLIIGLSIPISILLTLMAMTIFGFTLNLMTLTGLIMGMCMTLDASIVIIENIHNYRERGTKSSVAAILGSREMLRAITTSTITTLCVFIPIIIYKNELKENGILFSDLIFTVVISLSISLVVAVTLVPSLSGSILQLNTRKQKPLKNRIIKYFDEKIESFLRLTENGYKKALQYCLTHRLLIISLVAAILIFSLMQFSSLGMNMNVRMRTDDNVTLNVALPRGTAIDVTEKILFDIEDLVKSEVKGYLNLVLTANRSGTNQGSIQITLPPPAKQIDTPAIIIRKLTPHLNSIPGTRISFRAGRGMSSTSPIIVAVSSKNYPALMATAEDIQHIMMNYLPEIEYPTINLDEGAPQLQIEIDRDRASNFGLSLAAIAAEIRTAMDGELATTMSHGNRLLNIQVRLKDEDRQSLPNLDAISVISRNGTRISLSNVANISEGRAPSAIRRERQERVLRVTGDLEPGIAVTDMQRRLEQTITERLVAREGVTVRYLGEASEIQSFASLYIIIVLTAIFLIFGIMASQFESFVDPLIIIFSIPLLFIGVIWVYKFSGQAMSMFSIVGIIACVGVVINNGIVLVDYTNTLCARGMEVKEACVEAGRRRLRPILMTSLTTILGMAPIAFFPGAGADTIQPIGKTFVGGLFVSTFMTIFVTPIMYSVFNSWRSKKQKAATSEQISMGNEQLTAGSEQ